MDTRFWGPDGWRLLHSVAASYPRRPDKLTKELYREFFITLASVLPCIYCRNSFHQYIKELPIEPYLGSREDLSYWLYEMHNKVNDKLAGQGLEVEYNYDFDGIYKWYLKFVGELDEYTCQTHIPGLDFIYCIVFNFPKDRNFRNSDRGRYNAYLKFFPLLAEVMPFRILRTALKTHLDKYPVQNYLTHNRFKRWIYRLESDYSALVESECPTFKDRSNFIEMFRAGCTGKGDPKPTCHV